MLRTFFLTVLAGLIVSPQSPNSWRGITPLQSTIADVERLLGKPAPPHRNKYAATYHTPTSESLFCILLGHAK
jgi:hypothetical protein